jgi:hypothetical protein
MKTVFRIALALALMVGFTSAATAQMTVAIGPKAGVNLADISGDDVDTWVGQTELRFGFAFGAMADISFSDMFAIHPEAYYSMQGTKAKDFEGKVKLNQLRIPVLLKVTIPTEGNISPYLIAGPEIGIKLSCDAEDEAGSVDCDVALEDEFGAGVKAQSFDYGLTFGAGVGVKLGPGMLTIDGRYGLGLADLIDAGDVEVDAKNSNIHFSVGYLYMMGQ